MELGIASNRYPGYREVWESYPGSDADGIAVALPDTSLVVETSSPDGEEVLCVITTPRGGQVEITAINQGPQYMYQHLRYMKILRDAPDVIRL